MDETGPNRMTCSYAAAPRDRGWSRVVHGNATSGTRKRGRLRGRLRDACRSTSTSPRTVRPEMVVSYQLVIDCSESEPLARFWAEALHYVIAPPPPGFDSWDDFYRSIGVPDDELGIGADRIEDPNGEGPPVWFQVVPEK